MKIASWNINSIRARVERLTAWLSAHQPDVVCLQELKCADAEFPADAIRGAGYQAVWYGQRTYNGVAILARDLPAEVEKGLNDGVDEPESRVIAATVGGLRIVNVYAPNGQAVGSPAYQGKLLWYDRLRAYLDHRHRPSDALVVTGDFNVAPHPIDVHDPARWEGQTLYSEPERAKLDQLVQFGLHDTFREKHPTEQKFSWWDYRMLAFPKGKGLRIDHLLCTSPLLGRCTAAGIDREARKGKQPSDHAPVWAEFAG